MMERAVHNQNQTKKKGKKKKKIFRKTTAVRMRIQ